MKKLKVGQEVLVVTIGNNARYGVSASPVTVKSIGRKWFTVEGFHLTDKEKFSLEDGVCDSKGYSPGWQVFISESNYKDVIDSPELRRKIINSIYNLTAGQMRDILKIINQADGN